MVKIKTCRISVFLWTWLNINGPISSLIGPEKMNILENIFIISAPHLEAKIVIFQIALLKLLNCCTTKPHIYQRAWSYLLKIKDKIGCSPSVRNHCRHPSALSCGWHYWSPLCWGWVWDPPAPHHLSKAVYSLSQCSPSQTAAYHHASIHHQHRTCTAKEQEYNSHRCTKLILVMIGIDTQNMTIFLNQGHY